MRMTGLFLRIYDWLSSRRPVALVMVLLVLLLSAFSLSRLHYEEDIEAFLPIDNNDAGQSELAGSLSEQSRISVIFRYVGADSSSADATECVIQAMDCFEEEWYAADTAALVPGLTAMADGSSALELIDFVCTHYPSFLTPDDYRRMDSLLSIDGYVSGQLENDRRQLLLPVGNFTAQTMPYDPLNLFSPVLQRLSGMGGVSAYRLVDGHVMHAARPVGLLFFDSPFGESESRHNEELSHLTDMVAAAVMESCPDVRISAVGSPFIAASNAKRIKTDSILAVVLAVIGILLVLWLSFRNFRDILWIAASLLFGAAFSLGLIGLFKDSISVIVIGLGSVLVGIAANYPLHFLHYLHETGNARQTLAEMVQPLLTGNITTVLAFFCLVFLKAGAMHDLAFYASFMLVGTILFVLVFLPVFCCRRDGAANATEIDTVHSTHAASDRIHRMIPWGIAVITLFMLVFGKGASFDTDLSHINYMTAQQREDFALLTEGLESASPSPVSVLVSLLPEDSTRAAGMWSDFWLRHSDVIEDFGRLSADAGFTDEAFAPFLESVRIAPEILTVTNLQPVQMSVIMAEMVKSLSDDFNMVLFMCGFIVFVFLWVSFGRLELALLSFLPLTVGWIWILGIMNMLGIQFNIVSIILATFIFGQGDDYTIFITEGLMREYAYGGNTLSNRRKSVLISAMIMFIGIGTLIVSRHPAMRSLAWITIIGMFVVVIMAHYLPEWVFRWLTSKKDRIRQMPVTLKRLAASVWAFSFFLLSVLVITPVTLLIFLGRKSEWKKKWLHNVLYRFSNLVIKRVPGTTFSLENSVGETFEKPAVIVCNHQSHLDLMCLMMLTPKIILVTNDWVWRNPFYGALIRRADFIPAANGADLMLSEMRELVGKGYSIAVFPEGTRSADCSILRFHKGAFQIASELGLDILPVFLHGVGHVLPKEDFMLRPGQMHVEIGRRISTDGIDARDMTKCVHKLYIDRYVAMCARYGDCDYWKPYVSAQYQYKGVDVERRCHRTLRTLDSSVYGLGVLDDTVTELRLIDGGQGEKSWLAALVHPTVQVNAVINDADDYRLASANANIPSNLHFILESNGQ